MLPVHSILDLQKALLKIKKPAFLKGAVKGRSLCLLHLKPVHSEVFFGNSGVSSGQRKLYLACVCVCVFHHCGAEY